MMKLIPPTNWDNGLILEFKKLGIGEVYGKMAVDVIGGGRPAYILPNVSAREVARHIKRLHEAGIRFNYILSAPWLDSQEFTRTGRNRILRFVGWLAGIGVDKVTVTIPYLAQLIKDRYPRLEICVSVFAGVDSLEKALFWQKLGAEEITLSQTVLNRDFNRLKLIRKNVACGLRLIGNTNCLYQCPLSGYHALKNAQASQKQHSHAPGLMIDYCLLSCRYLRLSDLSRIIRSNWIRPEDLGAYEEIGIDAIKLVDRKCSTQQLVKIVGSYAQRRFEGNLLELLPFYYRDGGFRKKNLLLKMRYFFHPFESDLSALLRSRGLDGDMPVSIDNRKLDGFIRKFQEEDCSVKSCADCGYCGRVAQDVIEYDKERLEKLRSSYSALFKSSLTVTNL